MNGATIVILVIIIACVAFVLRSLVKTGTPGCCGSDKCSGCSSGTSCPYCSKKE